MYVSKFDSYRQYVFYILIYLNLIIPTNIETFTLIFINSFRLNSVQFNSNLLNSIQLIYRIDGNPPKLVLFFPLFLWFSMGGISMCPPPLPPPPPWFSLCDSRLLPLVVFSLLSSWSWSSSPSKSSSSE